MFHNLAAAAVPEMDIFDTSEDLMLAGDTFHQFKSDYRNMDQSDRLNVLAQLQLRVAAMYAVQNEDMQRQKRQTAQDSNRKALAAQKQRSARQQKNQIDQNQHSQQLSGAAAEQHQALTHDLVVSNTTHAPEALMQEPHFQLADPAGDIPGLDLPQSQQFPYPPRGTRADRWNPT